MAQKDPAAVARDWSQRLSGSQTKITAGVQAVTTAPGQLAARQKAVWAQNVAAAQDKWAARTAAVSLTEWQSQMVNKGVPRIGQGATAAEGKFAAFLTQFLPHVDAGVRALPARGGLDQNINRMVAMVRHNAAFSARRVGL